MVNDFKCILTPAGNKIFREFFLDWTTPNRVGKKIYGEKHPRRVVYKYSNRFNELGYLEPEEHEFSVERKRGRGYHKYKKKEKACRGNLKPFFDFAKANGIEFTSTEENIINTIFETRIALGAQRYRNTVYKHLNFIDGVKYVLTDIVDLSIGDFTKSDSIKDEEKKIILNIENGKWKELEEFTKNKLNCKEGDKHFESTYFSLLLNNCIMFFPIVLSIKILRLATPYSVAQRLIRDKENKNWLYLDEKTRGMIIKERENYRKEYKKLFKRSEDGGRI